MNTEKNSDLNLKNQIFDYFDKLKTAIGQVLSVLGNDEHVYKQQIARLEKIENSIVEVEKSLGEREKIIVDKVRDRTRLIESP